MKCEVCGSDNWIAGNKLVSCGLCSFTRAKDSYFSYDPEEVYSNRYYHGDDYLDYPREKGALKRNFSNRLKRIRCFIPSGKMLEIGSAYGFFLEIAKNFFELEGVECNKEIADIAEKTMNTKIYNGPFEGIDFGNVKYDVIVAIDTIEHVRSPSIFLNKCNSILNDRGFLFIETGDIASSIPKRKGEKWRLVYPPKHLFYFSEKTISALLNKYGFKVIKVERVWFWRTAMQIIFRLFPESYKRIPKLIVDFFYFIKFPMNTRDLIFVTAQKISDR